MADRKFFDVIIIGGSYAGLAAGMALGRALRQVLIIDSGQPCNIQTPHSHNFITQDGNTPKEISTLAKQQVEKYETVTFYNGLAVTASQKENGFEISTEAGDLFGAKKLLFATGVKDIMPAIGGAADCWGISILHCPYCHGYEVRNEPTGILANGDIAFEFAKLISNWTKHLTVFTNGKSTLSKEQSDKLEKHHIQVVETEVEAFQHAHGYLQNVIFKDGARAAVKAIYARLPFEQRSNIPLTLGCELTEQGHIQIDAFQKTTVYGVFAAGDNATYMRSIANVVAMGTLSGVMLNKELIEESF